VLIIKKPSKTTSANTKHSKNKSTNPAKSNKQIKNLQKQTKTQKNLEKSRTYIRQYYKPLLKKSKQKKTMPKKTAKIRALLMLPLAAVLFLIGWVISYLGSNKVQHNKKQTRAQNNKIYLGVLLPEHELKQSENRTKTKIA
jgi:type II secretory pathway component PulL